MRIIEITEDKHEKMKMCLHKMKNFLCEIEEALEESSFNAREDDYDYRYRRERDDEYNYRGRGGRGMGRY